LTEPAPDFELMGIVNVTPDSFSDGGRFLDTDRAVVHGLELAAQGATILDIGGESTRPGAEPVADAEELRRVIPVIEGLRRSGVGDTGVRISIDTSKSSVARAALHAGAEIVNDVTALRGDPEMAALVARQTGPVCLMHMLGEPRTMQADPRYEDVVADVVTFLLERRDAAVAAGIDESRIWLDPGIGFGKTVAHNLALLDRVGELVAVGRPVVIGTSRKSFLGRITGRDFDGLVPATVATNVLAYERGVRIFRVHDVAQTRDALLIAAATVRRSWPTTTTLTSTTTTTR
jgi:dihydropteroate synthase